MAVAAGDAPVGASETLLRHVVARAIDFGIYASRGERVVLRGGQRCHRRCVHWGVTERIRVGRVRDLANDRLRGKKTQSRTLK